MCQCTALMVCTGDALGVSQQTTNELAVTTEIQATSSLEATIARRQLNKALADNTLNLHLKQSIAGLQVRRM